MKWNPKKMPRWFRNLLPYCFADTKMHLGSCYPEQWARFKQDRSHCWAGGWVQEVCQVTGKYCIIWYSYN